MKKVKKIHNGFPYIQKGDTCGYCGRVVELEEEDPKEYPADFGDYAYQCPECYRDGCSECMPMGRGCMCPECEDAIDES